MKEISLEKIFENSKPDEEQKPEIYPSAYISKKVFEKISNLDNVVVKDSEFEEMDYLIIVDNINSFNVSIHKQMPEMEK